MQRHPEYYPHDSVRLFAGPKPAGRRRPRQSGPRPIARQARSHSRDAASRLPRDIPVEVAASTSAPGIVPDAAWLPAKRREAAGWPTPTGRGILGDSSPALEAEPLERRGQPSLPPSPVATKAGFAELVALHIFLETDLRPSRCPHAKVFFWGSWIVPCLSEGRSPLENLTPDHAMQQAISAQILLIRFRPANMAIISTEGVSRVPRPSSRRRRRTRGA